MLKKHLTVFLKTKLTQCGMGWLALLLSGCTSIGPFSLTHDRYNYNIATNYSINQQLLLNMVRLRYDENPLVLDVTSISGSVSVQKSASFAGSLIFPFPYIGSSISPNGSWSYSDNPIISYAPLSDSTYTQSYLVPMSLYDISLLLSSGWSIPRVFRTSCQQIGNVYNAPSAARATSSHVPEYQDFINMTYVLRRMQLAEAIRVYYDKNPSAEELILLIDPKYKLSAKDKKILDKAGVEIYQHKIIFSKDPAPHRVLIVTRSVNGILHYLSKGLTEPPQDLKSQVLTATVYKDGSLFDWQKVVRGMMKIYYSDKKPPANAYVSIPFRGRWYYIADSDSDSKQTLMMVLNIHGLINTAPSTADVPSLARVV